mmetsp:Transcript_92891/g.248561  ORF Transcript_92891/g.248561 Transcript_92891/m.248561 type:complete len:226 (+) Transcript_92891:822-1499(+)
MFSAEAANCSPSLLPRCRRSPLGPPQAPLQSKSQPQHWLLTLAQDFHPKPLGSPCSPWAHGPLCPCATPGDASRGHRSAACDPWVLGRRTRPRSTTWAFQAWVSAAWTGTIAAFLAQASSFLLARAPLPPAAARPLSSDAPTPYTGPAARLALAQLPPVAAQPLPHFHLQPAPAPQRMTSASLPPLCGCQQVPCSALPPCAPRQPFGARPALDGATHSTYGAPAR